MGKGDRKSRRGKIFKGSYGVVRPKKTAVEVIIPTKKKTAPKQEAVPKKKTIVKKKAIPKK